MSRRGPGQAWRGTEHSGQGIRGEARRARAEEGSAPGTWPAARPPPAPSTVAGPARPARPPPAPQLASGPAQRRARGGSGSTGSGDARAFARWRRGGASHSHRAPCSSDVLIYCNCLRRDLGAGAGRRGTEWGREREGSPCSRPRVPATPRSRAAGGEGAGAARPPPVRPAGSKAGGAPGPAGRGRGRRGARRAACAGWAIWREWSGREWGSPRPPTPEPELEEEVEGAAGSCRLRAGLHRGASSGFLGCRRRCAARELVESTLKPPPEQLEGWGPGVFLSGGVAGVAERWLPACQSAQPGVALKSWSAGGLAVCPSPADCCLVEARVRGVFPCGVQPRVSL